MKKRTKNYCINLSLFLMTICMSFSQKVIESPSFEVTTSGITHISKIELSKTATRIYIHNTFIPNWWLQFKKDVFIKDSDSGKVYRITGIEGGEFGEQVRMPKSGENNMVLIFPALDKGVKKIDYNDQIYGVLLKKKGRQNQNESSVPKEVTKWIDAALDKVTQAPINDFKSNDFFQKKKAKFIGYIKGYDPRLGFETGIIYIGNDITREDYPIVVQIHADGRFEAEIPLTNPGCVYLKMNKAALEFYLEPGQTLAMILDWEEFLLADRYRNKRYKFIDISFKGNLAQINQDLLNFDVAQVVKEFKYKTFKKKLKKLTPEQYQKEETLAYQKNLVSLNLYLDANDVTEKATVLLNHKMYLSYATHLFDFASKRRYEAKKDSINEVLKIPVKDEYYRFLQEVDLNDQSLLVLNEFSTFVNRFEFSAPMRIYPKRNYLTFKPAKTILEYLAEENIVLSEHDKELLENRENKTFKSSAASIKYLDSFSEAYQNGLESYNEKYVNPYQAEISKKRTLEKWRLRDSVISNTFCLEKNLVYDLVKVRALDFDIQRSDAKNAHEYWKELKKDIGHDFLKEEGERMVKKAFPISNGLHGNIEGRTGNVLGIKAAVVKLPEGKPTDVFRKIIDPFKGKILFIDFWATSCGPCVGGIKRMKETRKKYEGNKDFDFVFITNERSSPLKTYDKLVKEQELKNIFRLSPDDFNYLRQLFKFNGIPRYVVIDKNGDVIHDKFPMYNFDDLLGGILDEHK